MTEQTTPEAAAGKPAAAEWEGCAACPRAGNCRELRDGRGFMPYARIMQGLIASGR